MAQPMMHLLIADKIYTKKYVHSQDGCFASYNIYIYQNNRFEIT